MSSRANSKINHRQGQGAEKLLGELELAIMQIAWSHESVTVRDALGVLGKKRRLAYTTVMTVMGRLANKGLLSIDRLGKTYHYRAAFSRDEFETQAAGKMVQSLLTDFGGQIALSQFVKQLAETDPDQLARLAELARQAQEDPDDD